MARWMSLQARCTEKKKKKTNKHKTGSGRSNFQEVKQQRVLAPGQLWQKEAVPHSRCTKPVYFCHVLCKLQKSCTENELQRTAEVKPMLKRRMTAEVMERAS